MLRDSDAHRLPQFAGQRVRMVSVVVELANRAAARIVRRTCALLAFDRDGRLDRERFGQQQAALAEAALATVLGGARRNGALVGPVWAIVRGRASAHGPAIGATT
jgi:hypothetical protein